MVEGDWVGRAFEEHRGRLRAVAYRMLGSASEADDAVQEAWLRLGRAGAGEVDNLGGWLTTVVARVCLDLLRARASRREQPLEPHLPDPLVGPDVVLRAEQPGAFREARGAAAVAEAALGFARLADFAHPVLVNGAAGVVAAPHGRPFSVLGFTVVGGRIVT